MNREIFPGGLYPLMGDVNSTAGTNQTTVVAIQGTPVDSLIPSAGEVLGYNSTLGMWTPTPNSSSILVNSTGVSDDYLISVNVPKEVKVNGV